MSDVFSRAVFLDKDGTINEDLGYEKNLKKICFLPNAIAGIQKLKNLGFLAIIISNQSGIGRGLFSEEDYKLHLKKYMTQMDDLHASVSAAYYCPHHPTEAKGKYLKKCSCRKPSTGLLQKAQAHFSLDLAQSVVIGDKRSDLELADNAGCRSILVKTGRGNETRLKLLAEKKVLEPNFFAGDLLEAAFYLESRKG
jgi:D-glycero-D-manno-heptose 1,7-bisphosphate phosphatase